MSCTFAFSKINRVRQIKWNFYIYIDMECYWNDQFMMTLGITRRKPTADSSNRRLSSINMSTKKATIKIKQILFFFLANRRSISQSNSWWKFFASLSNFC